MAARRARRFAAGTAEPGAPWGSQADLGRIFGQVSWPYVAGFALAQTWTVLCIALPDPVTYGEPFYDLRWLSLVTALAVSLGAALWRRLGGLVSGSRPLFVAVGVVASAASLMGPLSALLPPGFSAVAIHVAAVGVGVGFAWLYLSWYERFCERRDMMGLACSVVASLLFVYPLANVLSTDQVSPWFSSVVGSLLPALSVGCSFAGPRWQPVPDGGCRAPAEPSDVFPACAGLSRVPDRGEGGPPQGDAARCWLFLRFGLCLAAVVVVVETVRNLLLGGTAIAFYSGVANLGGAALKVACAAWLIAVFDRRDARGVSVAYRISFLLLLGVVLCMPLLLQGDWVAHMLLDVASFFFQMIVLMVLYQMCIGFEIAPVRAFGMARALWAGGTLLGIGIEGLRGLQGPDSMQLLPVLLGVLAAAAFVFVFTDRDCVEVLASMPEGDGAPNLEFKVRRLGRRCGVSDRELEVVMLVAQGRSAARIAESLGVSLATVNSHVHHVYCKLGVHSRQELLDAVEREGAGA